MAIDPILYPESTSLALPRKSFYPTKIPILHRQLREYISHSEPDTLFYVSERDVYHLNTTTRKRKHIATLPWPVRCMASGYGYVCAAGKPEGLFAIMKMEDVRHTEVDSPLRIGAWASPIRTPRMTSARVERCGEQIINSISIHQIHDEEDHLYDTVAVLSNNDRTVRIYSLTHGVEANVIDLPDAINHAAISPDGKTLVAVADINTVFFLRRVLRQEVPQIPKPHNRLTMTSVMWKASCSHRLHAPSNEESIGYFTTAWSGAGKLLAVGSESGYITLFDMSSFNDAKNECELEPVRLITVASSRPGMRTQTYPGAVRSILFAPDPWDLLIWAEDQGRVCIADLRTLLRDKQVIDLDTKDDSLQRVVFEDVELDGPLLMVENNFGSSNSCVDRPSGSPEDGLTQHEQLVLESLRTGRQREEFRVAQGMQPSTINYTSANLFDPSSRESAGPSRTIGNGSIMQEPFPELSRSATRGPRGWRLGGMNNRYILPPIYGSPELVSQDGDAPGPSDDPMTRDGRHERARAAPSPFVPPWAQRAPETSIDSRPNRDTGPWRTISDAMDNSSVAGQTVYPLNRTDQRLLRASEAEVRAEQIRALAMQRDRLRTIQRSLDADRMAAGAASSPSTWARYERFRDVSHGSLDIATGWDLLSRRSSGVPGDVRAFRQMPAPQETTLGASGMEIAVRIAGLAASRDGRTIWVASEDGIFEVEIALKNRARWAAVSLR